MSFIRRAVADKPLGLWELDDVTPFQDHSGYGRNATFSGTEVKHPGLFTDSAYSVLVDDNNRAVFDSPIFLEGKENSPFSIEAWVRPYYRNNYTAQKYRENLVTNPVIGVNTNGYTGARGAVSRVTSPTSFIPSSPAILQFIPNAQAGTNYVISYNISNPDPYKGMPVTSGKTYTYSGYVRKDAAASSSTASNQVYWYNDAGAIISQTTLPSYSMTSAWTRFSYEGICPEGATKLVVYTVLGDSLPVTDKYYLTGFMLEESDTLNPFFDGSMTGYEWTGTAHDSTSRTIKTVSRINIPKNTGLDGAALTGWNSNNSAIWTTSVDTTSKITGVNSAVFTRTSSASSPTIAMSGYVNGSGGVNGLSIQSEETYTYGITIVPELSNRLLQYIDIQFMDITSAIISTVRTTVNVVLSTTSNRFVVTATAPALAAYTSMNMSIAATSNGVTQINATTGERVWMDDLVIEKGVTDGSYFNGSSPGAKWSGATNNSPSYMLAAELEQQLLGHADHYDGLTVNKTTLSFVTKYQNTGEARAEYNLKDLKNVHVVGVHTPNKNMLYVDGELVSEASITEEQKSDRYSAINIIPLTAGQTTSSRMSAIGGVGFYATALSSKNIAEHYLYGKSGENTEQGIYAAEIMRLSRDQIQPMFTYTWDDDSDWERGKLEDVAIENGLVPQFDDDVSLAGTWRTSVDLYNYSTASPLYGVIMDWLAEGIEVRASLDEITWVDVIRNKNISLFPDGFVPSNQELFIEVFFPGGIVNDESYMDELSLTAFKSKIIPVDSLRNITVVGSADILSEHDPVDMADDWGIKLEGSRLTIPYNSLHISKTIEIWFKVLDPNKNFTLLDLRNAGATGNPFFSVLQSNGTTSGAVWTTYLNGVTWTSGAPTPGIWQVAHFVASTNYITPLFVNSDYLGANPGGIQIGRVNFYETALSAAQISNLYSGYVGGIITSVVDASAITLTESADPASVYAYEWAISASSE